MALLQISEPGMSAAPHEQRLAVGIDLGTSSVKVVLLSRQGEQIAHAEAAYAVYHPLPGWAERGAGLAGGHGNSVPRFHLTLGTGPELVRVFREPLEQAEELRTVLEELGERLGE